MRKMVNTGFLVAVLSMCGIQSLAAVDASDIEAVMRKFQNKYHYVAVVNNFSSKYVSWPQLHCSAAPSYPIDFYGEITENEAKILVDSIVSRFYGSGIWGYFLETLPEGEENYQTVIVTPPSPEDSWQNRLGQVDSDIDKLIYYRVHSINYVDYIVKSGGGSDSCEFEGTFCDDFHKTKQGSFDAAKSEAESNWNDSTSGCSAVGVATYSYQSHWVSSYWCGETKHQYSSDYFSAFVRSTNVKLRSDLSRHTGTAHCYLKLNPSHGCYYHGVLTAVDGIASYNPVTVETDPNENPKFYSWGSPSTGQIWTSGYLFSTNVPSIPAPSRITWGPDEDGSYSKANEKAWSLSETLIVVEPSFDSETDPVLGCASPSKLVYKNQDKHIVYSAGVGCGYESGETVKGRIIVNDYVQGMQVEVKLKKAFSEKVAQLKINSTVIAPADIERIYCFWPTQDGPGKPYYVPFSVSAYINEDQVSFSTASVYSESLGEAASDPNEAQRIKTYRGQGEDYTFQIKTNGYECCNRKETLDQGNDKPKVSKHENGDIETFFTDISQSYIWGSGSFYPPHSSYSKTCSFLDMSIAEYVPNGGSSGEYIKLFGAQGNILIYSIDSDWLADDTAASASFIWELDANGNVLKAASYDANGRLSRISNAADPDNFYREFHYEDPANPNRITSYTDYAGQVSRTYTLVYDQATGRLAGTIGGTGSGCSSCALPGENRLYFYNDAGYVLAETDIQGSVIHEYEYDDQNRLIAKWLGSKTNLNPVQEIVYDAAEAEEFGGSEIQDVYDYTTDGDYRFTRKVLGNYGQTLTEITYDELNINASAISSDPNVIIASGGRVTTYEYEYSGSTLLSISTQSPGFNEGTINTYYKITLNNPSNSYEDTILVTVDPNGIEPDEETVISRNQYSYYNLNGVSVRRLAYSYDAKGIAENKYTRYTYSDNGPLNGRAEPGVYQLNGSYTELNYNYTYYADGRTKTLTVSNYNQTDTKSIETYFYNYLGHPTGTETKGGNGNLLSSTKSRTNGFGEQIYSIDKSGVARGKEYDTHGKLVSEFIFADADDTTLFDGNDPNALKEDISGVYGSLQVISQKRFVYNDLGRLSEEWIAVADGVFTYNNPQQWHVTSYGYDIYSRRNQQVEDTAGLALATTFEYDNQGELVKTTYPAGHWQRQVHNGRGLLIRTIDGYGPETTYPNDFIISEKVYDADGNVLKEINGADVVASYQLDNRGMVFRQYQGDYETEYCDYTEFTRDLDGHVIDQKSVDVDAYGNKTIIQQISNRYNARGELTVRRILNDPDAGENDLFDRVILYSYDFQGKPAETVTKKDGNSQIYTNAYKDRVKYQAGDLVEQNWYDLARNLRYSLRFEYAGDSVTSYNLPFNSVDNALRYTKASQDVYIVSQSYASDRLSERKILKGFDEDDPYFNNWSYPRAGLIWHSTECEEYDNAGRICKIIDADDNFKTFCYNSRNQRTEETLWQGKPILRLSDGNYDPNTFDPYPLTKVLVSYDNAGRKIRQSQLCDPNSSIDIENVDLSQNKVVDTVYDNYGRLYRQRSYFDGINERISLKEYSYDGHSRVNTIEFCELEEVNVFGTIWETKFPQKSITYHYDNKGQNNQYTVTNVNTLTGQTADIDSYYGYDSQGRLNQIQNAQGITYSCKYDAIGRKTEETNATGKITRYVYNPLGDLADTVEDPTGLNRQIHYGYDRLGRQKTLVSGSNQTEYEFNYLGQIENVEYPNGDTISFGYDMLGAAIRRTVTKGSQPVTTHYKRNALGRVCYKQYTNEPEWSEPNNLLPFDEILYDALGNKHIIAYIDGENDLELNLYSYDYFGNLTGAGETCNDFSSSVAYTYDQRGLLTSLTYPNEKTVVYKRDALGRVESVSYEDKTLVEYGYLGDRIISKTMANANIEYTAAVDTLGRITGETFSEIPTSQSFIANSYGYTSHSNRLDERNGIDYGFDTLGRVTGEDAMSYTCDILGNPTNAVDDGLTYGLDNEERIQQVSDALGVLGTYEYDRLGRRAKKTADGVDTNFVYDFFGNVIAEYSGGNWSRDYIYGGMGEVVYMRFPQTSEMNDALDNFVNFVDAWLCYPDCTQDDLQWDSNADNQINLIDWVADANDFAGAFVTNGRYLLTDFRNSVIGKVNLDGSVDEISYNAWGTPYVMQGTDIEGLSILWNGYFYDYETGDYYLRNRYYSPLERRFLTDDPHGINPDGTWSNGFDIQRQYSDGYGLQVYAQGDPVNNRDDWGLWQYALQPAQRSKETKTFVVADGVWEMKYNIKGLAQLIRLNEEEFDNWGKRALHKVNGIKKCGAWVPNTAYVNKGDVSAVFGPKGGITFVNLWVTLELNDIERHFEGLGYRVQRDNSVTYNSAISQFSSENIIAWSFGGHGFEGSLFTTDESTISDHDAKRNLKYKLAEVILLSCQAGYNGSWKNIISKYGTLRASELSINAAFTDWEDLPTE